MLSNPAVQVLQAKPHDVRTPADCEHHLVDRHGVAAGKLDDKFIARLLHRVDRMTASHGDAALPHFRAQMLAHIVIEAAQNVFAAIDQGHLAAETGEYPGKLDGDVAATLNQNALR